MTINKQQLPGLSYRLIPSPDHPLILYRVDALKHKRSRSSYGAAQSIAKQLLRGLEHPSLKPAPVLFERKDLFFTQNDKHEYKYDRPEWITQTWADKQGISLDDVRWVASLYLTTYDIASHARDCLLATEVYSHVDVAALWHVTPAKKDITAEKQYLERLRPDAHLIPLEPSSFARQLEVIGRLQIEHPDSNHQLNGIAFLRYFFDRTQTSQTHPLQDKNTLLDLLS